jgi:chemotaxis protein methyltransferase CheR
VTDSCAGGTDSRPNLSAQFTALPPIARRDFQAFRELLLEQTGVSLGDQKRELLIARLSKRVRALGLRTFGEYFDRVINDGEERAEMIDRILTNETRFFREPHQFEFLEKIVIPRWLDEARAGKRERHARIWSAGCSMGQEPASIAMVLLTHLAGWTVEILATDLSRRVLKQAASGIWPTERAAEIPERYLREFMLRGVRTNAGVMKSSDTLRSVQHFRRLNLSTPLPEIGVFDAVFCRNVLIYFDADARRIAIDRMLSRLRPNGYLFLGHSESLVNTAYRLRTAAPSVYMQEPPRAGGGSC